MKRNHDSAWRAGWLIILAAMLIACQASAGIVENLSAAQARLLIDTHQGDSNFVILDVRTPAEYQQGHISGALLNNYKAPSFSQNLDKLDRSKTFLVYCRSGNRSRGAVKIMVAKGFTNIFHMSGGILDWQKNKYPLVKSP
jgi:rhodanese-related sulfurtransferase